MKKLKKYPCVETTFDLKLTSDITMRFWMDNPEGEHFATVGVATLLTMVEKFSSMATVEYLTKIGGDQYTIVKDIAEFAANSVVGLNAVQVIMTVKVNDAQDIKVGHMIYATDFEDEDKVRQWAKEEIRSTVDSVFLKG